MMKWLSVNGGPYGIECDGQLKTGEYYGPGWFISRIGSKATDPGQVVVVADPGDGSALPLAKRIAELLNSEQPAAE